MDDITLMGMALDQARLAEGRVSPRPPVGAVVADRDGIVAGSGHTRPVPGPHAEVVALEEAGDRAWGGTLYTSLEPCCFSGVTPPCTEAILRSGVRRVVAAVRDPYPEVDGKGFALLSERGIELSVGVLEAEATEILEPFAHRVSTGRPLVTLKLAASLDGKVAAPDGTSRWITGEPARREVHELRRRVDAVLVGSGTVCTDDPSLTSRLEGGAGHQPTRVVVDSSGRTPADAAVFDGSAPTIVVSTVDVPAERRAAWRDAGAEVVVVPATEAGVDLSAALDELGARGVCHVLCEGGPTIAAALVADDAVQRFVLYLAPKIVGDPAPGLFSAGVKTISDAWPVDVTDVRRVGVDLRVDARRAR